MSLVSVQRVCVIGICIESICHWYWCRKVYVIGVCIESMCHCYWCRGYVSLVSV